jgi:hypothetical protein
MRRIALLVLAAAALLGCGPKTGLSSSDAEEQAKQWNQDAYEKAMIDAGREEELKEEKEKWARSQQQGQEQPEGQGGPTGN